MQCLPAAQLLQMKEPESRPTPFRGCPYHGAAAGCRYLGGAMKDHGALFNDFVDVVLKGEFKNTIAASRNAHRRDDLAWSSTPSWLR